MLFREPFVVLTSPLAVYSFSWNKTKYWVLLPVKFFTKTPFFFNLEFFEEPDDSLSSV